MNRDGGGRIPVDQLSAAGFAPGQVPVATGAGGFKPGTVGGGLLGVAYVSGTMGSGLAEATTHNSSAMSIDDSLGDPGISTDGTTLDVVEGLYAVTLFAGPVSISGGAGTDITRVRLAMLAGGSMLIGGTSSVDELSATQVLWFGSGGGSGYKFQFTFDVLNQTGRTASLSGNTMSANILRFPFPS